MLPFFPQILDIKATSLGLLNDRSGLVRNRHINHLTIQRPRTSPRGRSLIISNDNAHRPGSFFQIRPEDLIYGLHLRGMNALLPIES